MSNPHEKEPRFHQLYLIGGRSLSDQPDDKIKMNVANSRRHGDGILFGDADQNELSLPEIYEYIEIVKNISQKLSIPIDQRFTSGQTQNDEHKDLAKVVLALKEYFSIAFSNGCSKPESSLIESINTQITEKNIKDASISPALLVEFIKNAAKDNKEVNLIYGQVLKKASIFLKTALSSTYHREAEPTDENKYLPESLVEGKTGYGLANTERYEKIALPLKLIIDTARALDKVFHSNDFISNALIMLSDFMDDEVPYIVGSEANNMSAQDVLIKKVEELVHKTTISFLSHIVRMVSQPAYEQEESIDQLLDDLANSISILSKNQN